MKFSLLLPPVYPPHDLIRLARLIEASGFDALWYPDEKLFREVYIGLALIASHTERLRIGPCVTDPYSRHPIMTAAAIATLSEIAPGRVWLGLGSGGRGLNAMNIKRQQPARALRETIEIIRALLRGETVDYQGKVIQLNHRRLDFSPIEGVPIFVGTGHGPLIQRLAFEIADGVMLANYASPGAVQNAFDRIRRGIGDLQRPLDEVYIMARVSVAIHDDPAEAAKAVAPSILSVLRASYPALEYLKDLPCAVKLPARLVEIMEHKDYAARSYYASPERLENLIPSELVEHLAIAGDAQTVGQRLRELKQPGIFGEIVVAPCLAKDQDLEAFITQLQDIISGLKDAD